MASTAHFGSSVERDATLSAWLVDAVRMASRIGVGQANRVLEWSEQFDTADEAIGRFRQLPRVMFDDDLVTLNHQATFATLLRGMEAAAQGHVDIENAFEGIAEAGIEEFGRLPFEEAIQGLARRLGLIKWSPSEKRGERLPSFIELDAANRSRAFTMAWVEDLGHLQQVHDELVKVAQSGESLYDWRMKHVRNIAEGGYQNTGWLGSPAGEWHYQLVYRQNLGMAYSAGRYEKGTRSGFRVVRILPTLSQSPRPDHAKYAGQLFRIDDQSMLPPWDFGCNCGWVWVFPEELERMGIDPQSLPLLRFENPKADGFNWRPAAYMALDIQPGQYTGIVRDIAEDMGSN